MPQMSIWSSISLVGTMVSTPLKLWHHKGETSTELEPQMHTQETSELSWTRCSYTEANKIQWLTHVGTNSVDWLVEEAFGVFKGYRSNSEGLLSCVEERLLCVFQWVKSGPEGRAKLWRKRKGFLLLSQFTTVGTIWLPWWIVSWIGSTQALRS